MLGVMVRPVDDDVVKALKLDNANGAIVAQVTPGSGADKAGIQAGDIIIGYNGHAIDQGADLPPLVAMTRPGTRVPVEVLRNGKKLTLNATVGTMPRDKDGQMASVGPSAKSGTAALGLVVQPLDKETREQLGLKPGEGVVVSDITGPVAAQTLQAGDVILMVNQQRIGSVDAFRKATAHVKPGDTVLLLVRRGDQTNFVSLSVPSDKSGD
jgi:serine protease Do